MLLVADLLGLRNKSEYPGLCATERISVWVHCQAGPQLAVGAKQLL